MNASLDAHQVATDELDNHQVTKDDLSEHRANIDELDKELAPLLAARMQLSEQVAWAKQGSGAPLFDAQREEAILARATNQLDGPVKTAVEQAYRGILLASKGLQHQVLATDTSAALVHRITQAGKRGAAGLDMHATVACQGIEGAYAHQAALRMLPQGRMLYFQSFDAVFRAVEQGLCCYGVLPLENNTHGSVKEVYDLLGRYQLSIVAALRLPVAHCLLSKELSLKKIRKIYSHEQALGQCSDFLAALGKDVELVVCENTAVAARMVARGAEEGAAALSSAACAALYGLNIVRQRVVNDEGNETRFVCIARELAIAPDANRTTISLSLGNEPGSLATLLQLFASRGIDLTKIENRPLGSGAFKVVFYLDLACSAASPLTQEVLAEAAAQAEDFTLLGSYQENG